jgi:hypothetical protein
VTLSVVVPDAATLSHLGGLRVLGRRIQDAGGGRLALSREGDLKALAHLDADEGLEALGDLGGAWVYRTDVHVVWDRTEGAQPEVSRTVLLQRNPNLDHAAFVGRWTVQHAELARQHHPGIIRYVQRVVVEALTPAAPPADGIASLAYGTEADLEHRQYDSPEGQAIIQEDVAGFLDREAGRRALGPELDVPAA